MGSVISYLSGLGKTKLIAKCNSSCCTNKGDISVTYTKCVHCDRVLDRKKERGF